MVHPGHDIVRFVKTCKLSSKLCNLQVLSMMKKLFLLIYILILSVSGCTKREERVTADTPAQVATDLERFNVKSVALDTLRKNVFAMVKTAEGVVPIKLSVPAEAFETLEISTRLIKYRLSEIGKQLQPSIGSVMKALERDVPAYMEYIYSPYQDVVAPNFSGIPVFEKGFEVSFIGDNGCLWTGQAEGQMATDNLYIHVVSPMCGNGYIVGRDFQYPLPAQILKEGDDFFYKLDHLRPLRVMIRGNPDEAVRSSASSEM